MNPNDGTTIEPTYPGAQGPNDAAALAIAEQTERDAIAPEAVGRQIAALSQGVTEDPSKPAPQAPAKTTQDGAQQPAGKSTDSLAIQPKEEGDPQGDRPAWLDPKFKTPEDLAKAYTELERKQGSKGKAPDGTLVSDEDLSRFAAEVTANGDLSAESYKALAEKKIPTALVKSYVEGFKLQAQQLVESVFQLAGGRDQYGAMSAWAASNVPKAELAAYNADVNSGDRSRVAAAVSGMTARYRLAGGSAPAAQEPNLFPAGGRSATAGIQPFRSQGEVNAAMSDPRYAYDEAYRQEVAQRLSVSTAV